MKFQIGVSLIRSVRKPLVTAVMAGTLSSTLAAPYTDAGEGVPSQQSYGIEEVVVTAQKRQESLQDVPLAVSAFDANAIADARIEEMSDIVSRTPNLSFTPFAAIDPQLFIRGVGSSDDGAGGDPSVVVFVDDIAVNRASGASFELYDMQRIEVLRGPQGTLYGKNAVGGAINFITNKPEEEFSASFSVTPTGDHNRLETKGHLNIPLNDKASLRIAGATKDRDGFSKNITTGNEVETIDTKSGRVQLRYLPSDQLDILLSADYTRDNNKSGSRKPVPAGSFVTSRYTPHPDPRKVEAPLDGYLDREIFNTNLRVDWELDFATLTSITAYRETKFDWVQDLAGLPTPQFILGTTNYAFEEDQQFTQELRLSGDVGDGALNWVAGLYYSAEEIDRNEVFERYFAGTLSNPNFDQFNDVTTSAVFGQFTYAMTDRLSVTLGGRYTVDEKDIDLAVIDLFNGAPGTTVAPATEEYNVSDSERWSAFAPKLTVDYAFSDSSMAYASVAKGYKAGGYQSAPASGASAKTSFDPEFAINYELGAKTQWLDDRLRVNASVFYMDYTDLQVLQLVEQTPGDQSTLILVVENAADAIVQGVELEVLSKPFQGLEIGGSYSWLDATFDEFLDARGNDHSGNRLRRSPKNSYDLFVQYGISMRDGGKVTLRGGYSYKGTQFFESDNRDISFEDGRALVDASIKYISPDEKWDLTLWGKNLTDELYRASTISVVDSGFSRLGAPRTWGLTFAMRFDN